MSNFENLKIGTLGPTFPPAESISKQAGKNERRGYDSIWFPDHLMGWWPQSIWTPEIMPISSFQPSPHIFMETMISMTLAAQATEGIKVGSSVTEVIRRHPAMLAQSIVTLDHVSKGRTILGLGAGEAENITPYGMDYSKPVSRLEEALEIINILWDSEQGETIDYNGEFWQLEDAVFDLPLYDGEQPPIWLGAHGPRMLRLTAKYADGWLPGQLDLKRYRKRLTKIKKEMKKEGRNFSELTAGLFTSIIIGEDRGECLEIMNTPGIKARCLLLPSEVYEEEGIPHPLGEDVYGPTDLIPSRLSKEETLEAIESVPLSVAKKAYLYGSVDDIIGCLEDYVDEGMEHLVFWNETFFGDPEKLSSSYKLLGNVVDYLK